MTRSARAAITTGTFFANRHLLSEALQSQNFQVDGIDSNLYTNAESGNANIGALAVVIPNVTAPALIAVSILTGVQTLAILALLVYIYRTRVWTHKLDSLALARIGAQLDLFGFSNAHSRRPQDTTRSAGPLGTAAIPVGRLVKLWKMNGIVDTSMGPQMVLIAPRLPEASDGVELETMPPPYSPRSLRRGGDGGQSSVTAAAARAAL